MAQARATSNSGSSLTVPFPSDFTSLSGGFPGLKAGSFIVKIFNQTGSGSWLEVGMTDLTVEESRPPIAPNPVDLAFPPEDFTVTGTGFGDFGFGLPVVNFYSGRTLVAQARAVDGNEFSLTVPFPTNATSLGGPLAGLSPGVFKVKVFNQTGPNSWAKVAKTSLTVVDSML
jgi:hypothetical protein